MICRRCKESKSGEDSSVVVVVVPLRGAESS